MQEAEHVTTIYWVRIGMQTTATQLPNSALGSGNGSRIPNIPDLASQRIQLIQSAYQCEVETLNPPSSDEFKELTKEVGAIVNETCRVAQSKAITALDHVEAAHMVFLALVERYGEVRRVKVSGGGTGQVNADTRSFVAEYDYMLASVT